MVPKLLLLISLCLLGVSPASVFATTGTGKAISNTHNQYSRFPPIPPIYTYKGKNKYNLHSKRPAESYGLSHHSATSSPGVLNVQTGSSAVAGSGMYSTSYSHYPPPNGVAESGSHQQQLDETLQQQTNYWAPSYDTAASGSEADHSYDSAFYGYSTYPESAASSSTGYSYHQEPSYESSNTVYSLEPVTQSGSSLQFEGGSASFQGSQYSSQQSSHHEPGFSVQYGEPVYSSTNIQQQGSFQDTSQNTYHEPEYSNQNEQIEYHESTYSTHDQNGHPQPVHSSPNEQSNYQDQSSHSTQEQIVYQGSSPNHQSTYQEPVYSTQTTHQEQQEPVSSNQTEEGGYQDASDPAQSQPSSYPEPTYPVTQDPEQTSNQGDDGYHETTYPSTSTLNSEQTYSTSNQQDGGYHESIYSLSVANPEHPYQEPVYSSLNTETTHEEISLNQNDTVHHDPYQSQSEQNLHPENSIYSMQTPEHVPFPEVPITEQLLPVTVPQEDPLADDMEDLMVAEVNLDYPEVLGHPEEDPEGFDEDSELFGETAENTEEEEGGDDEDLLELNKPAKPQNITDNPLNFLNLVGTDFQPGRLVNIFFGLFIMLFMIIIHGYALWIMGIAYLPGTRSSNQWELDLNKVDAICNLVSDALDFWENRIEE